MIGFFILLIFIVAGILLFMTRGGEDVAKLQKENEELKKINKDLRAIVDKLPPTK